MHKALQNLRINASACPQSVQTASGNYLPQIASTVLSVAYLLWLEGISKDWLLSYVEPYPFMASLATTVAVIGGFAALLLVQKPMRWLGPVLCITFTLTVADLSGITPTQLGIFPAVPVLSFALGAACLFSGNRQLADRNEKFYAAVALVAGAISLCARGAQSGEFLWALFLILAASAVSGLAIWLAKSGGTIRPTVLAQSCGVLMVAGFGILVGLTFGPSLSIGISDAAMLGLGLEWQHRTSLSRSNFLESLALLVILTAGVLLLKRWLQLRPNRMGNSVLVVSLVCIGGASAAELLSTLKDDKYGLRSIQQSSSLDAFGRTLATEYGLFTALVVGLLLWTAVVTGVLKLLHVRPDTEGEAQGARIVLCAGSVSTLFGLLLSSRLEPPFMTSDSITGTATLAIVVASAGVHSSSLGTSHRPAFFGNMATTLRRKVALVLLTGSLVAIALMLSLGLYYWRNTERMIQPYMDGRAAPGFSSGFTPLSEISATMRDAIIACEDPGFFDHRGFEWRALHSALRLNLREARIILGYSTITQQLAKNLFLTKERTLGRKIREAVIAFALERLLSKERILELYLNVIEYGSDQRGILAAADYYFHKSPKELSLAESALLAGLISQTSRSSSLHELAVGQRRALTLMRWKYRDRYSEVDIERASAMPLHGLLRATVRESGSKEDEPNLHARATMQNAASAVQHWRNLGLLIGLGIFVGCVATVTFGARALRVANRPNHSSKPPNMRMKMLLAAATCSLFAMFGLHWYQINRELALTTVHYPYRHSPNFDMRPIGSDITCVVLYAAGQPTMEAAINSFQDPNTKSSPHFLVGKDGRIFQMVPVERRAWHAGNSQLESKADVDNFSVGITLLHQGGARDSYSDLQYEGVARIIHQLRQDYDISDQRIVSHSQIALPAGIADPEGFDFDKLRKLLHSIFQVTN